VTPGSTPDNPSTSPSAWRSSFGPDAFAQTPARCPHGLRGADHGGPDRPDLDEHRFGDNANANANDNDNANAIANAYANAIANAIANELKEMLLNFFDNPAII
jgi:hypothetical protein